MSGEMVAGGAPSALAVGGEQLDPFNRANAAGAMTMPPPDILGGSSFGEIWTIDSDKKVFVNKKTHESRPELFIQIAKGQTSRVYFKNNERTCWSDDAVSSYTGICCASCPRVCPVDAFNRYYEKHPDVARPTYIGDGGQNIACSLRYTLRWKREFVVAPDGRVMCYEHEDMAMLNCPESSIYAFFGANGFMPKLQQMGADISQVLAKVTVATKEHKAYHKMYSFAVLDFVDMISNVMPKVSQTIRVTKQTAAQSQGGRAAYSAGALPQMSGVASAPAPAAQSVAPGSPFGQQQQQQQQQQQPQPQPQQQSQPQLQAASPFGAPSAAGGMAMAGFPAPMAAVAPTLGTLPPAQGSLPGFPGAVAPVLTNVPPFAATAPLAAAPAPTIQDMAKTALISEFGSLSPEMKALALQVLQVTKIEDVTTDRVANAIQAVRAAKNYNPGQTASSAPGAPF